MLQQIWKSMVKIGNNDYGYYVLGYNDHGYNEFSNSQLQLLEISGPKFSV